MTIYRQDGSVYTLYGQKKPPAPSIHFFPKKDLAIEAKVEELKIEKLVVEEKEKKLINFICYPAVIQTIGNEIEGERTILVKLDAMDVKGWFSETKFNSCKINLSLNFEKYSELIDFESKKWIVSSSSFVDNEYIHNCYLED